jgi:hypothetical protein
MSQGRYAAIGAADWLSLAATPAFAAMALLTGVSGDEPLSALCGSAHSVSPLAGMGLMYLLMSGFHSAAWLKLIGRGRSSAPPRKAGEH